MRGNEIDLELRAGRDLAGIAQPLKDSEGRIRVVGIE
jgi:hypothetical protein